jgi:hypothetical protein
MAGDFCCWPIASFVPFCAWRLLVEADIKISGRPPRPAGSRSISRPSGPSTETANGLGPVGSRSLRQEHRQQRAMPLPRCKQSGLEPVSRLHAAPWQPHQLISGRAPSARTKILHTRGSSAPRWMGLVSRTADKANPASSVTHPSRLRPGSVGQTQQLVRQRRLRRSAPCRFRRIARERSPACARAR